MTDRVLVTGADGCIGAWVVRLLVDAGVEVVTFDLGIDDHRHRLVGRGRPAEFERITGDVTDADAVVQAMRGADRVIHLAALQVPFCQEDPALGAAVNVVGTVNVFEAAMANGIGSVAYASSIAVFGAPDDYPTAILEPDAVPKPRTLYGAYKVANEQTAAVYAADRDLASIGLRPHTVYGPGRDQGLTSQPTVAIERAVRRERFDVDYGGTLDFQYAPDVARLFIAAAGSEPDGATVVNVKGHVIPVAEFVGRVRAATGFDGLGVGIDPLPLPNGASSAGLERLPTNVEPTPLDAAIDETCEIFATATATGG